MALTITRVKSFSAGAAKATVATLVADSTYTTGGYALAASDLNKITGEPGTAIGSLVSFDSETNTGGTSAVLDRANSKVLFMLGATECTTTISSKTVRVRVTYGVVGF